jgi:peptidoglycan/xylan/chitin deacetylase (PgdA/CDA1 family)
MNLDFGDYLLANRPYLASEQINRLIDKGFAIGAHSIDHPVYSSLSLEDQLHQTIESVRRVREIFHLRYGAFAFPFSDHNISKAFFAKLSNSGFVDLSFGTAGLVDDDVPNHLQRFSLEKPAVSASRILRFQHVRKLEKILTRNPIKRK